MLKKYYTTVVVFFLILSAISIYLSDNNAIFWSLMIAMYLVSNKLLDSKNENINKYESIFVFIGAIILFLSTFTSIIKELSIFVIIIFTIIYIYIIVLKIIEQKNKSS